MKYMPLFVVLPLLAGTFEQPAAPDLKATLALKGPIVVRCADGLLAFDSDDATLTSSSISLKKNATIARMAGDFANHPHKPALAELALIAMENVAAYNGPGKLKSGDAVVEVSRIKQPEACEVSEVVVAPLAAEYDKPVVYRQMNMGGRPIAILNLRYLKKQPKKTTQACVVRAASVAAVNAPLPPDLHAPFIDELARKQQKFFKQVLQDDAPGAPPDAYELQLQVLGSGFMDGEGHVAFVSFQVIDRSRGKTISYGRGFRAIGTKQEKDIRDFATILACL